MELLQKLCKNCGGDLIRIDNGQYKCHYCGSVFEKSSAQNHADEMHKLFDQIKLEAISNARRNLYDAVNAEYISSFNVHECCVILKQLLPDDFQANFYQIATGTNVRQITKAIRKIDVEKNLEYIESVIKFLIRSLQTEYQLELNNLIAKAFENRDPAKFEYYSTYLAEEAIKVDGGVYETKLPREIFVAYSSKDMDKVSELVEILEGQRLKCFVAARNLRHGKGAVENYNKAIEEAMDHCRSVVFVSSTNSRSFNCDALTIELPYIQARDLEIAPPEFRQNYISIPQQYKKPRVEYRIGESMSVNVADAIVREIFEGYERVYSPEEVAERVMKQLIASRSAVTEKKATTEENTTKYCVACKNKCSKNAKFCSDCGGTNFAQSLKELELLLQIEELNQKLNEQNDEEKARIEAEEKARIEAEEKARIEAEEKARIEAEEKARIEAEEKARIEAEEKARIEAEEKARIEAEEKAKAEQQRSIYHEKALKAKAIAEAQEKIDAEERLSKKLDERFSGINSGAKLQTEYSESHFQAFASRNSVLNTTLTKYKQDSVELEVPFGITVIGANAINAKDYLRRVVLPSTVLRLEKSAFWNCKGLRIVHLSENLKHIGEECFWGCQNLEELKLPESISMIGKNAFKYCGKLEKINIPSGINKISDGMFNGCNSLSGISLHNNIESIGSYSFCDCNSLTQIDIPEGVTSIGEAAFMGCYELKSITLPSTIKSIGQNAFMRCGSLKNIYLPTGFELPKGVIERGVKIHYI